jgi:hypothetical protein
MAYPTAGRRPTLPGSAEAEGLLRSRQAKGLLYKGSAIAVELDGRLNKFAEGDP